MNDKGDKREQENLLKMLKTSIKVVVVLTSSWVVFIAIIIGMFVLVLLGNSQNNGGGCVFGEINFPEAIENQRQYLVPAMEKNNIPVSDEAEDILLGQLWQESGANKDILATDPWQSSESLCGSIGCITDPQKSTDQAMKIHKENLDKYDELELAGDKSEIVMQAYNFGQGYLFWLSEQNKEHSEEVAEEYSISMTLSNPLYDSEVCPQDPNGKACYGDYKYITHIKTRLNIICGQGSGEITTLPFEAGSYVVTQNYGETEFESWHDGIDLVKYEGASIHAVGDGTVVFSGVEPLGANVIQIKHSDNLYTSYAHLKEPSKLKEGDEVKAGDVIGYQGNTGNSTASHLHFEVREDSGFGVGEEYTNNPQDYLPLKENQR